MDSMNVSETQHAVSMSFRPCVLYKVPVWSCGDGRKRAKNSQKIMEMSPFNGGVDYC